MRAKRRTIVAAVFGTLAGLLTGCSGADNPTIAEAPKFKAPPPEELVPPKIRGRSEPYGSSKKYQDAMERMARGAQGQ
jgi:hypothetical protein